MASQRYWCTVTRENLLLTGSQGQLGSTFLLLFKSSSLTQRFNLHQVDINDFDLTDQQATLSALSFYSPSIILNCGAYTAVDEAEDNPELAEKINGESVGLISNWCADNSCRLIHISTDFVFDGSKTEPYLPDDKTNPLGVYGQTKVRGERHILKRLPDNGVIIRTSWLYSEFGSNFVRTMINLMSKEAEINVVDDQIGSPTSTYSLSKVLMRLIERKDVSGIFHWCDGGSISWHKFAEHIRNSALNQGILQRKSRLRPILTSEYPTKAKRPKYSVLDRSGIVDQMNIDRTEWKSELDKVISKIAILD